MIKFALGTLFGFFIHGICFMAKDEPNGINSKIIIGNGQNYEVTHYE